MQRYASFFSLACVLTLVLGCESGFDATPTPAGQAIGGLAKSSHFHRYLSDYMQQHPELSRREAWAKAWEEAPTPVQSEPDAADGSDAGSAGESDAGTPVEPDAGTAVEPDAGTPTEPDAGTAVEPDAGTAVEPDAGTAVEPDAGTPVDPDAGTPVEPDAGTPVEPDAGTPPAADSSTIPSMTVTEWGAGVDRVVSVEVPGQVRIGFEAALGYGPSQWFDLVADPDAARDLCQYPAFGDAMTEQGSLANQVFYPEDYHAHHISQKLWHAQLPRSAVIVEQSPLRAVIETSSYPTVNHLATQDIQLLTRYVLYPDGRVAMRSTVVPLATHWFSEWRIAVMGVGDPTFKLSWDSGTGAVKGSGVLRVPGAAWPTNAWAGYAVEQPGWHTFSILGNTADTLQLGGSTSALADGAWKIASRDATYGWIRGIDGQDPFVWTNQQPKYLTVRWDPATPAPYTTWARASSLMAPWPGNGQSYEVNTHSWDGFKRHYVRLKNVTFVPGQPVVQRFLLRVGTRASDVLPDLSQSAGAAAAAADWLNAAGRLMHDGTPLPFDPDELAWTLAVAPGAATATVTAPAGVRHPVLRLPGADGVTGVSRGAEGLPYRTATAADGTLLLLVWSTLAPGDTIAITTGDASPGGGTTGGDPTGGTTGGGTTGGGTTGGTTGGGTTGGGTTGGDPTGGTTGGGTTGGGTIPAELPPAPPLEPSALSAVWGAESGDKVTRDELRASQDPEAVRGALWNGETVRVFGARNEVVDFQVILEAAAQAVGDVTVELDTLYGPDGAVIHSEPAQGDGVFDWTARPIELFHVGYLPIRGVSILSYPLYDERHVPARLQRPHNAANGSATGGWTDRPAHDRFFPDIAVPLELKGAFAVAQGENQSIWTDVYIPKDAAAGTWSGWFVVREGGKATRAIRVDLTVRDFTLPDEPAAGSMIFLGYGDINARYLGTRWPNPGPDGDLSTLIRNRHFQMAHRHRLTLMDNNDGPGPWSADAPRTEWLPRLDGGLYTAAHGYDGPGVGRGENLFVIGTYGTWGWKSGGEAAMWSRLDNWATWFEINAPDTEVLLYLIDESNDLPQIETWAQWVNSNPGPGERIRSFATLPLPSAAKSTPSLDIPAATITVGDAKSWGDAAGYFADAPSKRLYMYNGHRPANGSFATEDDGVALREMVWAQYKMRVDRWFAWESTYYNRYQGGDGENDVYADAHTFGADATFDAIRGRTGWNYSNGEGVLFYPGTDRIFPASSLGVNGPIASLRLKYWRRGVQDAAYLAMAAKIDPQAVAALMEQMVPKALWEYGVSDPSDPSWVLSDISWSIDPADWEAARAALAAIIESAP